MKISGWMFFALSTAVLGFLAPASSVFAQAAAVNPVGRVKLMPMRSYHTPTYSAQPTLGGSPRRLDWYLIDCHYETMAPWTDELTAIFLVLMKTADPKEPFVMLKGEQTFVNIEKGPHLAAAWIPPSIIKRYGKIEAVAVEFSFMGRPVAVDSTQPGYKKWAEQLAPKLGFVLPPLQTPFAMLNTDDYEMPKPPTAK